MLLDTSLTQHRRLEAGGEPRPRLTVGRILPWSLVAIAVLTVTTGLLPLEWLDFTDYQIARQVHPSDAPFRPSLRIRSDHYHGADALTANLASTENHRPRTFTTDSLGFRWTPDTKPGAVPSVMVFRGASFVWGCSLSDEETLPSQLARELHTNVYNGGRFLDDHELPADFDNLVTKLGGAPELAIFVQLEQDADQLSSHAGNRLDQVGRAVAGARYDAVSKALASSNGAVLTWMHLSPVFEFVTSARKAVQNDAILPNVYSGNAVSYRIPNGSRIVFQKPELERAGTVLSDDVIRARAALISSWQQHLHRKGIRMIAVLIPDKLSVYGPELGVPPLQPTYLDRLESELRRRDIPVVNGLHVLRPHAAGDLDRGDLSFWRDDLHWTPLGVKRIASAVATHIRSSLCNEQAVSEGFCPVGP
jgi:hypothetical protein